MARAYGVVKGTIDGASFTPSQAFYYGSADGVRTWLEMVDPPDGRFIDLADDLDVSALDKNGDAWHAEVIDPADNNHFDVDDIGDLDREPDIERITNDLMHISPETRDIWLRMGMAINSEFDGSEVGYQIWDDWSQTTTANNYDETGQRATWESFAGYSAGKRIGIGSLYRLAKERREGGESTSGNLRLFTPSECENLPPIEHLVEDILAPRQVACAFGAPGSGKSALIPYLAWCVSQGRSFFGKETEQGTVFYVSPEDDLGMARRITALRRRYGDAPNFYRVSPDGGPWSDFFTEDSKHIRQLRELIEAHRPALVVIDTLASGFNSLDENDGLQMKRAVRIVRSLTEHGAAVILVHHSQKGEGTKTPRGSGVLDGDMDLTIHVTRRDSGLVAAKLKKNRIGGLDAADIAFRVRGEPVGLSAKGKPITAAVLEEVTSGGAREAILPPLQLRLLDLLDELAEENGFASRAALREIAITTDRISSAELAHSRKRVFNDGMAALARIGLIVVEDDKVSRAQPDADVFDAYDDEADDI